jgi:hypothetical protein
MNALQQIQQLMRSPGVQVSIPDFLLALALSVVSALHSKDLEGIESSLREVAPIQKLNIFFNRQGVLL